MDGGYYQGQFKQNMMEGEGKLFFIIQLILLMKVKNHTIVFRSIQIKQFSWIWNVIQGKFDFANMNELGDYWKMFRGHFKNNEKAGKCQIILTNGEEFEGFCQNNTIEGNEQFKTLDN